MTRQRTPSSTAQRNNLPRINKKKGPLIEQRSFLLFDYSASGSVVGGVFGGEFHEIGFDEFINLTVHDAVDV